MLSWNDLCDTLSLRRRVLECLCLFGCWSVQVSRAALQLLVTLSYLFLNSDE